MNKKWENLFEGRGKVLNISQRTDRLVDTSNSDESSVLSEDSAPNFEGISEKTESSTISQLKSQIMAVTQNYSKSISKNLKLRQELTKAKSELSELNDKYKNLHEILVKNEEEK